MKVFIVFLGLCIINVSFLSYQGDMGRYIRCQNYLKAVAEECAAGAALYYDEGEFANGNFQFDDAEGRKYIEYIMQESRRTMPFPRGTSFRYEVEFQDDLRGYDGGNGKEEDAANEAEIPSVMVTITADTQDLFHLPFLEVRKVERAAKYELPQ